MNRAREVLIGLCVSVASAVEGQEPPAPAPDTAGLSVAECTRLADYRERLILVEGGAVTRGEILSQLRVHPPLAVIDGYWVSAVDLVPAFAAAERAGYPPSSPAGEAGHPGAPPYSVALAFVPHPVRDRIPLPSVGPVEWLETSLEDPWREREKELESAAASGYARPVSEILIVPATLGSEAIIEYLPPPHEASETEEAPCYYFCGDPSEWDFDADGLPNPRDPDDDGDGSPDAEDAYPYWPGGDGCECGGWGYVGFTEKFSEQVAAGIVSAYEELGGEEPPHGVNVGAIMEGRLGLRLFFPTRECEGRISGCVDTQVPEARYVARDPTVCASIRFRCDAGWEAFFDTCGCGCKPPE